MPNNPNRIDPTAAPATTPDPPLHPFTKPLVPQSVLPWAAAAVGIAGVLLPLVPAGPVSIILGIVVALGSALGIVSNGVKKPVD